jgi:esterase/lipase superfamily enzyme
VPTAKLVNAIIWFATNRKRDTTAPTSRKFNNDDSSVLTLGRVNVKIPKVIVGPANNLTSLWSISDNTSNLRFPSLASTDIIESSAETRSTLIANRVQASTQELLLFVHGFSTSFENAAIRSAQIASDLNFKGISAFYAWPSKDSFSQYSSDEEAVQLAEPTFNTFLDEVASAGFSSVSVVAHSMGTRLVSKVVLNRIQTGKNISFLKDIVLAAPDINVDLFQQYYDAGLSSLSSRLSIYASSNDVALRASYVVHRYKRLGDAQPPIKLFTGIDLIDASRVSPLERGYGHAYIVDSTAVIDDLRELITLRQRASNRNLRRTGSAPNISYAINP